jgi:protein subunit release factor A
MSATSERLERLRTRVADTRRSIDRANPRHELAQLAARIAEIEQHADDARRELVTMGWGANEGAIVEVRPVGGSGREARDVLVEAYREWAEHLRHVCDLLCEPREDDAPATLAIQGAWAFGMLRGEAGLHRLRLEPQGRLVVASVRVAAWSQQRSPIRVAAQRALKATGQLGGKIRSRLECTGPDAGGAVLVLQNARTLAENRELAVDLVAAWSAAPLAPEEVVRRYDRTPPWVRDARTGFVSGRPDALGARGLDALLKLRVDGDTVAR